MIDTWPAINEAHLIAAGLRNGFVLDNSRAGHAAMTAARRPACNIASFGAGTALSYRASWV